MDIGRIERVALQSVWPHEAHDFTRWVTDNIDVLAEALGLQIGSAEREQAAGPFNADIVATDASGDPIIIENQYGKSDHDHLGKLLTYMTAFEGSTAVWVVEEPRPEHVRAISWLNEASSGAFYLVKVEAIRIGESPAAPLFTLIVGPSDESRQVGMKKREIAELETVRVRFWEELLDRANQVSPLHANVSPSKGGWIAAGAGIGGVVYSYVANQHVMRVELYIDTSDEAKNLAIFDRLHQHAEAIEEEVGHGLSWQRLEGKQACRIAWDVPAGGYVDEEKWPTIIEEAVDAMTRLKRAIRPRLEDVRQAIR